MKSMYSILLLVATLFISCNTIASASSRDSQELEVSLTRNPVKLISNVVFSQPSMRGFDNVPLKMDILQPASKKAIPAVVFVTGGGFINANKDNYLQQRMDIANAGYVVASIEYRVAPTSTFPAPLEDVKSAVRYLRANAAKFGIDPQRIAVMGGSAGGYLAAFTGVTNGIKKFDQGEHLDQSSDVQAIIDQYGLSDLTKVADGFPQEIQDRHKSPGATEALWVNGSSVFGELGSINDVPEKAAAANPITYITKNAPPFLLMHGDKDTVVSPKQTEILHEALISQGVDSTRYIVKGAAHGGPYWLQPEVMNIVIDFLDKHLK